MIDDRPQADRILVAQLTGEARHRAKWRPLSSEEEAAAVAELRDLAGGRADLLAEVAGILEGASEGELDEPFARQAAGLCRAAGADPEAIPAWIEEGRRRTAAKRKPPFSGGMLPWSSLATGKPAALTCPAHYCVRRWISLNDGPGFALEVTATGSGSWAYPANLQVAGAVSGTRKLLAGLALVTSSGGQCSA